MAEGCGLADRSTSFLGISTNERRQRQTQGKTQGQLLRQRRDTGLQDSYVNCLRCVPKLPYIPYGNRIRDRSRDRDRDRGRYREGDKDRETSGRARTFEQACLLPMQAPCAASTRAEPSPSAFLPDYGQLQGSHAGGDVAGLTWKGSYPTGLALAISPPSPCHHPHLQPRQHGLL